MSMPHIDDSWFESVSLTGGTPCGRLSDTGRPDLWPLERLCHPSSSYHHERPPFRAAAHPSESGLTSSMLSPPRPRAGPNKAENTRNRGHKPAQHDFDQCWASARRRQGPSPGPGTGTRVYPGPGYPRAIIGYGGASTTLRRKQGPPSLKSGRRRGLACQPRPLCGPGLPGCGPRGGGAAAQGPLPP